MVDTRVEEWYHQRILAEEAFKRLREMKDKNAERTLRKDKAKRDAWLRKIAKELQEKDEREMERSDSILHQFLEGIRPIPP